MKTFCFPDKDGKATSLGRFLSAPQKTEIGNDIRLVYTDGGTCRENVKIKTVLTLKCKPSGLSLSVSDLYVCIYMLCMCVYVRDCQQLVRGGNVIFSVFS